MHLYALVCTIKRQHSITLSTHQRRPGSVFKYYFMLPGQLWARSGHGTTPRFDTKPPARPAHTDPRAAGRSRSVHELRLTGAFLLPLFFVPGSSGLSAMALRVRLNEFGGGKLLEDCPAQAATPGSAVQPRLPQGTYPQDEEGGQGGSTEGQGCKGGCQGS